MEFDSNDWYYVRSVDDLSEDILDLAWDLAEAWYPERIEWDDFFDNRLEGMQLVNGKKLALPGNYSDPVFKAIKQHINKLRRSN
jgi:hypothetical protein